MTYDRHEPPDGSEYPGYGIWPCDNPWHKQNHAVDDNPRCPDCPNIWWAVDGSECPPEYALMAEIDYLRERLR